MDRPTLLFWLAFFWLVVAVLRDVRPATVPDVYFKAARFVLCLLFGLALVLPPLR